MIPAYADTSFIFPLYSQDTHSLQATDYVTRLKAPLPLSPFLRFEYMQAVRLQMFRHSAARQGGLTSKEGAFMLQKFANDSDGRLFAPVFCDLPEIIDLGIDLSARYTRLEGYRSFDILHVATALHLKAKSFLTFDKDQAALAKTEGLTTPLRL